MEEKIAPMANLTNNSTTGLGLWVGLLTLFFLLLAIRKYKEYNCYQHVVNKNALGKPRAFCIFMASDTKNTISMANIIKKLYPPPHFTNNFINKFTFVKCR